jgi:NADPH2:quinone reductase
MRAVQVTELTGPEGLEIGEVPEPKLEGSGVLIDVRAAGVVFADSLISRGLYQVRPELPFSPGMEVAGLVLEASPDARVAPGDRVSALLSYGGMAERVVAPAGHTFPLVDELSFVEGAGLTANAHTAYFALALRAGLRRGERVLVHGAAGGLGVATLQVARALGARTVGVVSSARKAEVARAAGAEEVIVGYERFEEALAEIAPDRVDVVADPVGGEALLRASIRSLALDGRFVVLGFAGGEIPKIGTNRILFANVSVVGAAYGAYVGLRPDAAQGVALAVNDLVRAGHARPLIEQTLPLERAAEALRRIEARAVEGKLVLEI